MSRSRVASIAVVLVILVLTVRLLWVAAGLETGVETVTAMIRQSALGWLGDEDRSLGSREPTDQADFWLAEVGRILREQPTNAERLLGAAWMLDSPSIGHLARHLESTSIPWIPPGASPQLDWKAVRHAEDAFEAKCAARCLELARQAAERDPGDPLGWRSLALLVYRAPFLDNPVPRVSDPIAIWQECALHDPENALYDYLSALHLWSQAGRLDVDENTVEFVLVISDQERFDEVVRHLERGLTKPFFAIGEMAFPEIGNFLAESQLPKTEQAGNALDRLLSLRGAKVIFELRRLQQARASGQMTAGDPKAANALHQHNLRMMAQVTAADEGLAFEAWVPGLVQGTLGELGTIDKDHPSMITADERLASERRASENTKYAQQIQAMGLATSKTNLRFKPEDFVGISLPVNIALQALLLLLVLTVVFLGSARIISKRDTADSAKLGFVRCTAIWVTMLVITFAVFGIVPGGFLSEPARQWASAIVVIICELAIVLLAAYGLLCWLRRRNYQWSVRDLIISVAVFAVILMLLPLFMRVLSPLHDRQLDFLPGARGWGKIGGLPMRDAFRFQDGEWRWAIVQWAVYGGSTMMIASSLVLVTVWYVWRAARQGRVSFFGYWRLLDRPRVGGILRATGDSALWVGACCLIVWLWLTPGLLRATEVWHQDRMRYVCNPAQYWQNLKIAAAELLIE